MRIRKIYFFNHFKFNPNKNMNPKQTIPLIATLAPVAPVIAPVIPSHSAGNSVQNHSIPQNSGGKPNIPSTPSASAPAIAQSSSTPAAPKIPVPPPSSIPTLKIAPQTPLPPIKRKFVTREDLATIFQRGARDLTRTAAFAALKKIGFGKTAAYAALTSDGKFSTWLQFAPDGIITWTE